MIVGRTNERANKRKKRKRKSTGSRCVPIVLLFFYNISLMCERTEQLLSPYHFSFSSLSLSYFSASFFLCSSFAVFFHNISTRTRYYFLRRFLMDNNPLTPRASNFSIASLITSDCCDDENSLYHSMTSPIESNSINNNHTNSHLSNLLTNKSSSHDYYPTDSQQIRTATLTEANHGQYQQSNKKVTNLQKSLTSIRNMEGSSRFSVCFSIFRKFSRFSRLYSIGNGENQININKYA